MGQPVGWPISFSGLFIARMIHKNDRINECNGDFATARGGMLSALVREKTCNPSGDKSHRQSE
jgi:hypothetical protein